MRQQRVFVCEYLSGGGAAPGDPQELLDQGRAMRDAVVADLARQAGLRVSVAGDAAPTPAAANVAWVRPQPGEGMLDFVRREAAAHDLCWIVAPETGGLLACLRKIVGQRRWVGCDSVTLCLATSKHRTLEYLARHGVATPLAFLDRTGADKGRWVVKPDDGAGGLDTRVHATQSEALADLRERGRTAAPATLEPWVEGEAMSLSLLCRPGGPAELLAINRQLLHLDDAGTLHCAGVAPDAMALDEARAQPLHALAQRVAQAMPGLAGCVGIDFVLHPRHGPVLIEVNPRLTSAFVGLSARLGRAVATEALALFATQEAAHAQ